MSGTKFLASAVALVPLLSAGIAVPHPARFKDVVCVHVTAPADARPSRLIVIARGENLRAYSTNCTHPLTLRDAIVKGDTLTTPANFVIVGLGETELAAVDWVAKFSARLEGLSGSTNATDARTVTASRVAIDHRDIHQAFSIRVIDVGNR